MKILTFDTALNKTYISLYDNDKAIENQIIDSLIDYLCGEDKTICYG